MAVAEMEEEKNISNRSNMSAETALAPESAAEDAFESEPETVYQEKTTAEYLYENVKLEGILPEDGRDYYYTAVVSEDNEASFLAGGSVIMLFADLEADNAGELLQYLTEGSITADLEETADEDGNLYYIITDWEHQP